MAVALAAMGEGRLRALAALAVAAAAGAAPALYAFSRHDLTANGVALARREDAGVVLASCWAARCSRSSWSARC